ncbi:MAG: hypothetical protein KF859_05770 [Phycisphaeraceae bacterium]|nr:hypothetical protein [Phycisphaeraceae bacterium]
MHTDDDKALLLAMHHGHEAAARVLWERLAPGMKAYAGSLLRAGAASADDIVQNAVLKVLSLPSRRVREVRDVRAFLLAVTRREAAAALRSARRESARLAAAARIAPAGAAGEPSGGRVWLALGALPRRLREPVVLRHVVGLTFDQMALATGINRSTLAGRYQSALGRLRAAMGDELLAGGEQSHPGSEEVSWGVGTGVGARQEPGHV